MKLKLLNKISLPKDTMRLNSLFLILALIFRMSDSFAAKPDFYQFKVNGTHWAYSKRTSFLDGKVSADLLNQLDSIYKKNPSTYEFLFDSKNQTLKVFIHCSFDFYAVVDGKLIKEYKFQNRGYTCGSFLFKKNNSFHILGGRGLWNYHADLMNFDSLNGSWEFIQALNQPLDYFPLGTYQTSKGIMALFGEYNNPRVPKLGEELNGFFLDWKKKSWQPIQIDLKEFNLGEIVHDNESRVFETQDYALSVTTTQLPRIGWYIWILFEKETGKLFFYEGNKNSEIFNSPYHEVIGNKLRYFDFVPNSITEGKEVLIDLDAIRSQSREIGQVVLLDTPEKSSNFSLFSWLPWIGFPLVFIFALWMGIQLQKRKNTATDLPEEGEGASEGEMELEDESQEILQKLLAHDGEKISTEEFDELLGIQQITNFDSKRIKRSRLIKAINKHYEEKKGFPLITRIKNPEDKRFVFYKISFENRN